MTNTMLLLAAGSAVLLAFAVAYIVVLLSSHRRVTEAQRAKLEEVQKSEKRYRDLFDHSLAGMLKFSTDTGTVLDANDALRAIFSCETQAEAEQCLLWLPPQSLRTIQDSLLRTGIISELEVRTRKTDGTLLWILFSAKLVEGTHEAHGVVIDITERKAYEEKIREQAALLNETQDAIMVANAAGMISFWNTGAEQTYGWGVEEALGRSIRDLVYGDPQGGEFLLAMEDVHQFGEWAGEQHHRRKDGREILVQSTWKMIHNGGSGKSVILIVNRDITEKKRLEAEFVRAQRMESIALLTSGIAHDLHNILAPIAISVGLFRDKLTDERSLAILRAVEESAQSGLDLVKNILTYGQGVVVHRTQLDLAQLMDQVLSVVCQSLPDTVRIVKDYDNVRPLVEGDANQLKQVFLNIAVNARDAMPNGGTLSIRMSSAVLSDNDLDLRPDAVAGPHVVVTIADTGVGIPEDQRDRIFEPFFTSKEGSGGTGLGLSIALGIVKSHNGFIVLDSKVHRGSTFSVYLPAVVETDS